MLAMIEVVISNWDRKSSSSAIFLQLGPIIRLDVYFGGVSV